MTIKTYHIPIYFGYLRIVIADDFQEALVKLKQSDKLKNANDYDGFAYPDKTKSGVNRYTIFLHANAGHSIIAHEVVHAVNALYIDSGMQLDRHNDEHQAYIAGWFTEQVYKALKK